jgi:putative nucleotidyltransferase with HDIG domain
MSVKPIHLFVGLVVVAAGVAVAMQDWSTFAELPSDALLGLGVLTAIGLFSEGTALRLNLSRGTATSSVTFLPLLACALLFGPTASIVFFGINGVVAEFFIRKKESLRATFNSAQYVLSTAVAGAAFVALDGFPLAVARAVSIEQEFDAQLVAFAGFGVVFLVVNNLLVFLAISLSSAGDFPKVFWALVRRQTNSLFYDLFISPLGILIALLYFYLGILGLVIGLFPLVFVRHSYLAKFRLEQANHDLLKALVMAIETRDEYTSGHSLRVQRLSERIGTALGLAARQLDELSTAALLHDVGKIEVGYEEILQKPGALTQEEREIIQSHVLRGVEILTALSSLKPRVIEAVRYHHEAWDGSGYPYRIKGENIPLYARIIAVSDAIDAMLSDRPYRNALSVPQVEEQLRTFGGIQFDPDIASQVLEGDIISKHIEEIALSKGLKAFDADHPAVRIPIEGAGAHGSP